jgi:septal ring factor EnvC (AmiA/AmiB activator)
VARPERLNRITILRHVAVALLLGLGLSCPALADQDVDKAQAESRLGEVTRAIGELREQLAASRQDHRQEQARLREVALAIQAADLKFRELEQLRQRHLEDLAALELQREDYLSSLDERLGQLADQVRSSYKMGGQTRIKLILNQDDPARAGRMLAYYDYLNRVQVRKISALKEALTTLDDMQQSIDTELATVERVQTEQRTVLANLNEQRLAREELLAQLSRQIDSDESRLRELEQNRKDLEALIERLGDVLADIPADLGSRKGIAGQKGKLPMPLNGQVIHAFGQPRAAGMRWQGWLIKAQTGAEARAVAYGRVAFADWLRGYGLMMIIDHGQGFLSLYGHNESLLAEVGAWVEPGEVVSIVGSNPGSDQGLYFELRKNGKALDPAAWIAR